MPRRWPATLKRRNGAVRPGVAASFRFARPNGSMARNFGFEITEARPVEPLAQIHFGHDDGSPVFGLREDVAFEIENCRLYPMLRAVGVGAADDEDVVLASAGLGKQWIAPGHRKRNYLRPVHAQLPGDLRKEAVIADHHADFSERRIEHGIFVSGRDPRFNFGAGKSDFAILADDAAIGTNQDRHVVDKAAVAFDQSRNQMK